MSGPQPLRRIIDGREHVVTRAGLIIGCAHQPAPAATDVPSAWSDDAVAPIGKAFAISVRSKHDAAAPAHLMRARWLTRRIADRIASKLSATCVAEVLLVDDAPEDEIPPDEVPY